VKHTTRRTPFLAVSLTLLVALAACGGGAASEPGDAPSPNQPPADDAPVEDPPLPLAPAPWVAGEPLDSAAVPDAYVDAWSDAENRSWCGLLALTREASHQAGMQPAVRTARFGGGWGVAYDLVDQRSAFGVAGTGTRPDSSTYDDWPYDREWRDGSEVGYGPEGGSGPKQLAYLTVAGEGCLYNVWSSLGRAHLESLLEGLRRVDTAGR
jgi:hypothetical protein